MSTEPIHRPQNQADDEERRDATQLHHDRFRGEATLDELMSDPVMPALWQADHLQEKDVWCLIRETAARLRRRSQMPHCLAPGCSG